MNAPKSSTRTDAPTAPAHFDAIERYRQHSVSGAMQCGRRSTAALVSRPRAVRTAGGRADLVADRRSWVRYRRGMRHAFAGHSFALQMFVGGPNAEALITAAYTAL
jgi:hypothetical protein